jgi:hypothetical protein
VAEEIQTDREKADGIETDADALLEPSQPEDANDGENENRGGYQACWHVVSRREAGVIAHLGAYVMRGDTPRPGDGLGYIRPASLADV